jgi:hypothetical protein
VLFVPEVGRSVGFYRDIFSCEVTVTSAGAALLIAPGGFQIYVIGKGTRTPHPVGGVGVQYLMWAVETADGIRVLVAYPSPARVPRSLVENRLHS